GTQREVARENAERQERPEEQHLEDARVLGQPRLEPLAQRAPALAGARARHDRPGDHVRAHGGHLLAGHSASHHLGGGSRRARFMRVRIVARSPAVSIASVFASISWRSYTWSKYGFALGQAFSSPFHGVRRT